MAIRNVIEEGDEILRKKCREVSDITERIRMTMEDMVDTMRESEGVGLAAPQVGVMRRMFVAEPEPGQVYYMINPKITKTEGEETGPEACLSVPGYYGEVTRPQKIWIEAQDLEGNMQEYEFEDFYARVMCHEYDHLDGILYTDKALEMYEAVDEEESEEASEAGAGETEETGE